MDQEKSVMSRRCVLSLAAAFAASPSLAAASAPMIVVYRDPNCGCCIGWVRHLRQAGFSVTVEETSDLDAVRTRFGVPTDLASCHTAMVGGYVLEGHIPAAAVERLLAERPKATGLAVPGMPMGSPGMEGGAPERYEAVLFGPGHRSPYMRFVGTNVAA